MEMLGVQENEEQVLDGQPVSRTAEQHNSCLVKQAMLTKGMLHTTAGHASPQSELNVAAAISAVILLGLAFSRVQICIVGCFLSASILHTWLLPAMMHRVCCCCCCCCQPPKKPKVKAEKAAAAGGDENGDPVDGECRRHCSPVTMNSLVLWSSLPIIKTNWCCILWCGQHCPSDKSR